MSEETVTEEPLEESVPDLPEHLHQLRDHLVAELDFVDPVADRGELTLLAPAEELTRVLGFCKNDEAVRCELLSDVSAVHWPAGDFEVDVEETTGWPTYEDQREQGTIEVSYILRSVVHNHWIRVRVSLPDDNPVVASATSHYSSANFMEREVYDLMGVEFAGHPNLTRILMPEDWDGHPHRKDYPLGGVEVMYQGKTIPPPDERDY